MKIKNILLSLNTICVINDLQDLQNTQIFMLKVTFTLSHNKNVQTITLKNNALGLYYKFYLVNY